MKKITVTFGLISGAIVSVIMLATMPLWKSGVLNVGNGQFIGYTSMVIALSMVFFGIKTYRDNHLHGTINFLQGFKIGILITLMASVMYALTWELCFNFIIPDFTDQMAKFYYEEQMKNGASPDQLAAVKTQMDQFKEWYKNPLLRFGMTLMEIFPVGLIITLISAGLLRKKEIAPAS